jgi:plastocyanin
MREQRWREGRARRRTAWAAAALAQVLLVAWPALSADHRVVQRERQFAPRELSIAVNDRVTFVNADEVVHNAFSERGVTFDIRQPPGTSNTVAFPVAGDVDVQCAIHPRMKLVIHVRP